MSHFGMPGPGGSMGQCAVCGKSFITDVLLDLVGSPSGITSFNVGFVDQTLYAHKPKCVEAIKEAYAKAEQHKEKVVYNSRKEEKEVQTKRNNNFFNALPDGPLKKCLGDAITHSVTDET